MADLMYSQGAVDRIKAEYAAAVDRFKTEYEAQVARLIEERDEARVERDLAVAEKERVLEEYTSPARDRRAGDRGSR